MKTKFLLLLLVASAFSFTNCVKAQKFPGLDKSPHDISYFRTSRGAAPDIKVLYGRPQLKGRSLSKLAPNNKVWRTGANETTEITFYKDVTFGDKKVKAGTYALYTIPGEQEWTIILNTNLNTWGAYSYDEAKDAIRTKVSVSRDKKSIEAFSIVFKTTDKGAHMVLGWDTIRIEVPVIM